VVGCWEKNAAESTATSASEERRIMVKRIAGISDQESVIRKRWRIKSRKSKVESRKSGHIEVEFAFGGRPQKAVLAA
jgi:uncharacterized lipoprotein YmbA